MQGRNQMFETMKRGGTGRLENVVMPQVSDVAHHPAIGPSRGLWRGQFSKTQIQKGQDALISAALCYSRLRKRSGDMSDTQMAKLEPFSRSSAASLLSTTSGCLAA